MLPCCAGQGQDAAGNAAAGPAPPAEQQLTTQAAAHAAAGAAALLLELAKLQKLTALTLVQVSHHFFWERGNMFYPDGRDSSLGKLATATFHKASRPLKTKLVTMLDTLAGSRPSVLAC